MSQNSPLKVNDCFPTIEISHFLMEFGVQPSPDALQKWAMDHASALGRRGSWFREGFFYPVIFRILGFQINSSSFFWEDTWNSLATLITGPWISQGSWYTPGNLTAGAWKMMLGSRGYVQFPGCNCWGGVWIIRHLAKLPLHRKQKRPILYFPKGKLCKSVRKDEDMLFSRKVWTPYQTRGRTFGKMKKWNPKVDPLPWRRGWGLTFHFVGKDHIRDISTPLFVSTIFWFLVFKFNPFFSVWGFW